jgi:hypothetical protein
MPAGEPDDWKPMKTLHPKTIWNIISVGRNHLMLHTPEGTSDDLISIDERINTAREHKEIAIKGELRNGSPDQAVVVERGYDDLIRSLIDRRESILAQQNGKKGTLHFLAFRTSDSDSNSVSLGSRCSKKGVR